MFGLNKNSKTNAAETIEKTVAVKYDEMFSSLSESDYEIGDEKKNAEAVEVKIEAEKPAKEEAASAKVVRIENDVVVVKLEELLGQGSEEASEKKKEPIKSIINPEDINTDPMRNKAKKEAAEAKKAEAVEQKETEKVEKKEVEVSEKKEPVKAIINPEDINNEPVRGKKDKEPAKEELKVEEIKKTFSSIINTGKTENTAETEEKTCVPAVGWLVCIEGADYGKDFKIHSDHNYLGNKEGDIVVADSKISAKNHMRISFEPKRGRYYVSNFEGQEYVYVNDEPLNGPIELHNHDIIETGDSKFLFMGFCGEKFMWPKN